jgi:transcriptional regulator NrdR family protein
MVRRRRSCNVCNHEWGTYEFNVEDLIDLMELFAKLDGRMADTFGRNAIQRTKEYRSRKRREARNAAK